MRLKSAILKHRIGIKIVFLCLIFFLLSDEIKNNKSKYKFSKTKHFNDLWEENGKVLIKKLTNSFRKAINNENNSFYWVQVSHK